MARVPIEILTKYFPDYPFADHHLGDPTEDVSHRVYECDACGGAALDAEKHADWHEQLIKAINDVQLF